MPAYFDETKKTWYLKIRYTDWQDNHKQKMKRGFSTKKEALSWEREFIQKQSADMDMAFDSFVEVYFLDKAKRLKERSLKNKRYMIEAKISPYFGKKPMNAIKPVDILNWQNDLINQDYAATYLRMLQNQVTAIFNHAERFYGLKNNPCKKVDKMGRSNAKELSFWTKTEYDTFMKTIDSSDRYYTLFEILFWTGCRSGEALALTLADIDFEHLQINIDKTYYRSNKQDVITKPKTEQSVRVVDIPEFLGNEIQGYVNRIYGISGNDRLYPVVAEALQHKMKRHIEKSGVKRIRVHDLRHSHIALLIEKGIPPLAIAERAGHESISTTMNVYGHLYPNKQREIADLLNKVKGVVG